jgi:hypothetical protein
MMTNRLRDHNRPETRSPFDLDQRQFPRHSALGLDDIGRKTDAEGGDGQRRVVGECNAGKMGTKSLSDRHRVLRSRARGRISGKVKQDIFDHGSISSHAKACHSQLP